MIGGELQDGAHRVDVFNGTALVVAEEGYINSTLIGVPEGLYGAIKEAQVFVHSWHELSFGEALIDHGNDE